jgi:hypothetical protein
LSFATKSEKVFVIPTILMAEIIEKRGEEL